MQHVIESFIAPLMAVLGPPNSDNVEVFTSEYARLLKGFDSGELRIAKDHILLTHKGPARWPKLAECVNACEDARERIQARQKPKPTLGSTFIEDANKAELKMMDSEMGHEAARDGWANGLREFLMSKKRWPNEFEVLHLKQNAEFIDRCSVGAIDMGFMHNDLQKLAGKLVQRRNQIADRVVNGEIREDPSQAYVRGK